MKRIKKVGVLSLGKTLGGLYFLFGLVAGAIFSVLSFFGVNLPQGQGGHNLAFGVASIIIFPALYGVFGFIGGILCAYFFNLCAKIFGGIEIEID